MQHLNTYMCYTYMFLQLIYMFILVKYIASLPFYIMELKLEMKFYIIKKLKNKYVQKIYYK